MYVASWLGEFFRIIAEVLVLATHQANGTVIHRD